MQTRPLQAGCATKTYSVFLETLGGKGRSFAAADPFLTITAGGKGTIISGAENRTTREDPIKAVERAMNENPGSWAFGFLSYDYSRRLERLPDIAERDIDVPTAQFLLVKKPRIIDNGGPIMRTKGSFTAGKTRPNMTRAAFEGMAKRAREYIKSGDIYQVDLSQRFTAPIRGSVFGLYSRLREINPSPFSAYLRLGGLELASSSPERLIRVSGNTVETRPIAGTKKRSKDPKADAAWAQNLKRSAKERAEHIMMVDLARNDIGKVCEPGSVHADELMAVEKYSHVQHIVSNVKGTLADGMTCFDALRAIFPGGTITGAPKIRAMEIIDELEPVRRNIYTGSIGYFAPDGSMDFNIAIRTILAKDGKAHFHTGAGIVYDSNPRREYQETIYKAQAMLEALRG